MPTAKGGSVIATTSHSAEEDVTRDAASSQTPPRLATVGAAASPKTGYAPAATISAPVPPISLVRPTGAEKTQGGTRTEKVSGKAGEPAPPTAQAAFTSSAEAAHALPSKANEEGPQAVSHPATQAVGPSTATTVPATRRRSAKMG